MGGDCIDYPRDVRSQSFSSISLSPPHMQDSSPLTSKKFIWTCLWTLIMYVHENWNHASKNYQKIQLTSISEPRWVGQHWNMERYVWPAASWIAGRQTTQAQFGHAGLLPMPIQPQVMATCLAMNHLCPSVGWFWCQIQGKKCVIPHWHTHQTLWNCQGW